MNKNNEASEQREHNFRARIFTLLAKNTLKEICETLEIYMAEVQSDNESEMIIKDLSKNRTFLFCITRGDVFRDLGNIVIKNEEKNYKNVILIISENQIEAIKENENLFYEYCKNYNIAIFVIFDDNGFIKIKELVLYRVDEK